jgi:hypothetical protein
MKALLRALWWFGYFVYPGPAFINHPQSGLPAFPPG